jgi:catechol 2,3-dioxygenase-like lactoylglutathione lyase family enzyme
LTSQSKTSSGHWPSTTRCWNLSASRRSSGTGPTRHTEEVIYLEYGVQGFGLRPADGGVYRYYEVGIEHLAFEVDDREEVDDAYRRCISAGGKIQSPPEAHYVEDGEDYYAFFAFDPDGIRIEVFCWPTSPYRGA